MTHPDSLFCQAPLSRRAMLQHISMGFGSLALSGLLSESSLSAAGKESMPRPHHRPKAKSIIFCYMSGGVSHVDSLDPKTELVKRHGQPMPVPVKPTMFNNNGNIMRSPWEAKARGKSGIITTDLFPCLNECIDELAIIRSMTTSVSEHAQGNYVFHTGFPFMGHPSAGAWMSYGLGTENKNLPGFVVLQSGGAVAPHGGVGLFSSGYLPAQHQASIIQVDRNPPLANLKPADPEGIQKERLQFLAEMDGDFSRRNRHPEIEAAIKNYETAYRMQATVPELCDISGESEATRELYGVDAPDKEKAGYARQCLVARRLVERGVRFVELSCLNENIGAGNAPNPWDQHASLKAGHAAMAWQVDQPIAALIRDLKQRGLLDETLILFSGEFGRTPFSQGSDGRDHNPYGFSLWMAGGGIRGGTVHGATDDLGYYATKNPATIYDLYATILHQMGLDHERLTFRFGGRDFRLTDVHGKVMREII